MEVIIGYSSCKRIVCLAALGCLTAAPAAAQRETGPFAGLFGGDRGAFTGSQLDLRGSIYAAYDAADVKGSVPQDQIDSRYQQSGAGGGANLGLQFDRIDAGTTFAAGVSGAFRDYAASGRAWDGLASSFSAVANVSTKVSTRNTLRVGAGASYAPFYQFAPFFGGLTGGIGPMLPGFGFAASPNRNIQLNANFGFTSQLTKRGSLLIDGTWRGWRFPDNETSSTSTWMGRADYHYQIGKGLSARLGYSREQTRYNLSSDIRGTNQTFDAGVDYGGQLQFARRTTLAFTTSTSLISYDTGGLTANPGTHFRVNGMVDLSRGFYRTWSASVGYVRTSQFEAGFLRPILSDSLRANVGGQIAPRVDWSAGAGYSHGEIGFGGVSAYHAWSGSTRLTYAMSRTLGLYAQYGYFQYGLPPGASLLPLSPQFARQTVAAGLQLFFPIIEPVRMSRDTR